MYNTGIYCVGYCVEYWDVVDIAVCTTGIYCVDCCVEY